MRISAAEVKMPIARRQRGGGGAAAQHRYGAMAAVTRLGGPRRGAGGLGDTCSVFWKASLAGTSDPEPRRARAPLVPNPAGPAAPGAPQLPGSLVRLRWRSRPAGGAGAQLRPRMPREAPSAAMAERDGPGSAGRAAGGGKMSLHRYGTAAAAAARARERLPRDSAGGPVPCRAGSSWVRPERARGRAGGAGQSLAGAVMGSGRCGDPAEQGTGIPVRSNSPLLVCSVWNPFFRLLGWLCAAQSQSSSGDGVAGLVLQALTASRQRARGGDGKRNGSGLTFIPW